MPRSKPPHHWVCYLYVQCSLHSARTGSKPRTSEDMRPTRRQSPHDYVFRAYIFIILTIHGRGWWSFKTWIISPEGNMAIIVLFSRWLWVTWSPSSIWNSSTHFPEEESVKSDVLTGSYLRVTRALLKCWCFCLNPVSFITRRSVFCPSVNKGSLIESDDYDQ